MTEISLNDFYVILEANRIEENQRLQEGSRSGVRNGVRYRLDPPSAYAKQQYHVHANDYAWNIDGSRSHRSRWPNQEPSRRIKQVAADLLGIAVELLESYGLDSTVIMCPHENTARRVLEEAFFEVL